MKDKIKLTPQAEERLKSRLDSFRGQLLERIANNKFVAGEDYVEVTANDVERIFRSIVIRDTNLRKTEVMKQIAGLYAVLGALSSFLAIFYDQIKFAFRESPFQFGVAAAGVIVTIMGGVFYRIAQKREYEEKILFEKYLKNTLDLETRSKSNK